MNFFKLENTKSRIFGLDLLRFLAIFFVLMGHSMILVPNDYDSIVTKFMLDGVSIFFVLSGFLIGGILIKVLEKKEATFSTLLDFWKRRWLRTLPVYFFVLTGLAIFTYIMKPQRLTGNWYQYYFFFQNVGSPQPHFFAESWSLSIEEWFYLLVPTLFFIGLRLSKLSVKKTLLPIILLVIAAVIFYRFQLFTSNHYTTASEINSHIFMRVFPRLDAIMFGVLGSYVAYYFPKTWNYNRKLNLIIAILGFGSLYALKNFNDSHTSTYYVVWVLALRSIATLMMFPFLSSFVLAKRTLFSRFITTVSITSYSMYLVNLSVVIHLIIKFLFHGNLLHFYKITDLWIWDYIAFWVITFVLSFILYKLIEVPFMKLREKI